MSELSHHHFHPEDNDDQPPTFSEVEATSFTSEELAAASGLLHELFNGGVPPVEVDVITYNSDDLLLTAKRPKRRNLNEHGLEYLPEEPEYVENLMSNTQGGKRPGRNKFSLSRRLDDWHHPSDR